MMISWPKTHCPSCGARPGEMCRTKTNQKAQKAHASRPVGDLKNGFLKSMSMQMATLERPIMTRSE